METFWALLFKRQDFSVLHKLWMTVNGIIMSSDWFLWLYMLKWNNQSIQSYHKWQFYWNIVYLLVIWWQASFTAEALMLKHCRNKLIWQLVLQSQTNMRFIMTILICFFIAHQCNDSDRSASASWWMDCGFKWALHSVSFVHKREHKGSFRDSRGSRDISVM